MKVKVSTTVLFAFSLLQGTHGGEVLPCIRKVRESVEKQAPVIELPNGFASDVYATSVSAEEKDKDKYVKQLSDSSILKKVSEKQAHSLVKIASESGKISKEGQIVASSIAFLPDRTPLENGVPVGPIALSSGSIEYIYNPQFNSSSITCTLEGSTGDGDLLLLWSSDLSIIVCSISFLSEKCTVSYLGDGLSLHVVIYAYSPVTDVFLTCAESETFPPTELENGVPTEALSLLENEEVAFFYVPQSPEKNVACVLDGETGDADLFLRWGTLPGTYNGISDCASAYDGNEEYCELPNPGDDSILFVVVHAFLTFSDIVLTCTEQDPPPLTELLSAVPSEAISLGSSAGLGFFYVPLSPVSFVGCTLEGDNGDAGLFLRWGEPPDLNNWIYDCESRLSSNEFCKLRNPGDGSSLFVFVYAFSSFSDVFLTCTERDPPEQVELENGVPTDPLSLSTSDELPFFYVPQLEASTVSCVLEEYDGDADLFVRWGELPDLNNWIFDCLSSSGSPSEFCRSDNPGDGSNLFVLVYTYYSFADVVLTCTEQPPLVPIEIENGVPTEGISLERYSEAAFYYETEFSDSFVSCTLEGDNGDADLFLRWGELPELFTNWFYDCDSTNLYSSNEYCQLFNAGEGSTLFVLVFTYYFVSTDVVLTCTERDPNLQNGVSSMVSLPTGTTAFYKYTPEHETSVACTLTGDNGDADLYVRWSNELPMWDKSECAGASPDSNELCDVENPNDGTVLHVAVYAYEAFEDVALTCTQDTINPCETSTCSSFIGEGISMKKEGRQGCREICLMIGMMQGVMERRGWECGFC